MLSTHGFLRAFKAFLGKRGEMGLKKYKLNKPEKNYKVTIDSSVKNIRPYTACAIVKNLKFDNESIKEIIDIQEKIHTTVGRNRKKLAIGIYPLEKISLPIKFEARKPEDIKFIPLETDREMTGIQILQRHPTGRDYAHLLTNLDKFPIFVDSKNKILSMPPIINSHETGKITENTKDVFIECSGFDFTILNKVLNIIVTTLADIGGDIYQMDLQYSKKITTPNLEPEKLKISLENVNKLLGLDIKEKDLPKLLEKMGYNYKKPNVFVPAWRTDVLHEVDIAEDVAIAYGYGNLVPEIPEIATIGYQDPKSKINSKISEILAGLGLIEISSYHLIKENEINLDKNKEAIETLDSKTEYKILRPNLLTPCLRILAENKDNEYPQRIFEIGTVFKKDKEEKTETGAIESQNLLISTAPGNFTGLNQILRYLLKSLCIDYELKESSNDRLIEGRTAAIIVNKEIIGTIGEVHPDTLNLWNIKMPLAILEISLEKIYELLN